MDVTPASQRGILHVSDGCAPVGVGGAPPLVITHPSSLALKSVHVFIPKSK